MIHVEMCDRLDSDNGVSASDYICSGDGDACGDARGGRVDVDKL